MPVQSVLLLIVAGLNLILAIVVGLRNLKSRLNKLFMLTIVFNVLWALGIAFMLSTGSVEGFKFYSLIFLVAPMLTAYFLFLFSIQITRSNIKQSVKGAINVVLAISTLLFTTAIYPITNIKIEQERMNTFDVELLIYSIYALYFLLMFNASYLLLFTKARNESGDKAKQLWNIYFSAILSSGLALITNLVFPILGKTNLIWLGPMFTTLYVALVTYSISKNKLFDIKAVFVRSIAYVLSVFAIVLSLQLLLVVFFRGTLPISMQNFAFAALFVCVGFILSSSRKYFDKLTNKLFYRDAYDTQEQIDKLSKIAVSEYEIDSLASNSLYLLSQSIKPTSGKFILLDAHGDYYNDYKLAHAPRFGVLKSIDMLRAQTEQLFVIDEFELSADENKHHSGKLKLYEYLKAHDVAMSVRLSTKDEIVGFMLFGPKLSGNLYSSQDKRFVEIASNEMAISIQNARRFDEIKEFNETLKLEVERATRELRESNEKLQELDQAKDEFITMASHQLRTPLTSVKGYLSMVLEGDVGKVSKDQHNMLSSAFASSQRMVYLIADLLNVSRLQTGKFVIEPTLAKMPDVIESEIDQLHETAKAKDITISYKKPKKFPDVYLDETKTRQVVMNFIDNAIYYTPAGGKVDVSLEGDEKTIEFRVKDNGIGVPKSEQHNLFTKFYRAENARKARPDGTGLGLFMAKKVVVDQGGALIFESKEGKGSTFGFSFPLSRVRPPKKQA